MKKLNREHENYSLWMNRSPLKHAIKIKSAPNNLVWYSNKIGRSFDAELVVRGSCKAYYIDYLHFIPAECCELIEIKKPKKYKKI